jgi:glycosyltransferase involved in cell wall biosynthesis
MWGVEPGKIRLIPNSISTELFQPSPSLDKTFDFVCVSRLVPWKGVEEVAKAAIALNCSLLIIGDGPEKESLEELTSGASGKIKFTGPLSRSEIITHLQESRVFVLNSSFEATSYALLEAMAVGIPGIANYNTGSEEVITSDVDGILCGGNSGKSIHQAMEFALANPDLINAMGEKARAKIINEFDVKRNFHKILSAMQ